MQTFLSKYKAVIWLAVGVGVIVVNWKLMRAASRQRQPPRAVARYKDGS